ncbi:MAG: DUF131 domain-containing protein [Archaeoglobaceae archaeon]|nr:DUF131 domain-containing protein [Archaeoglobaceae archaeon]MDW8118485.1 DUF131 domain-containing protein [Archaeoglobaceae archaeon]
MDVGKLMLGFTLAILGLALLSLSSVANVNYGAILMIGPVPIVVSSDSGMAIFLILLTTVIIATIYLLRWWK